VKHNVSDIEPAGTKSVPFSSAILRTDPLVA
jgi:hypothetical protein